MTPRNRVNLAAKTGERWRPPAFSPLTSPRARAIARIRRWFDLQAGSLWRDLAPELSKVSGTLVDVGCGAQPYRGLLSPGVVYVGLDTEQAEADFGYSLPDVRRIDASGGWPVADGEADLVLATETLEHVSDPALFLSEARRSLRDDGRLIVTVPFAARWHYIPHDYWRFTPSGLRLLLEHAGFSDVCVYGRGNEVTVACYKLLALLLPVAMPQGSSRSVWIGVRALLAAPPIACLTALANLSLRAPAGDDCLGYTSFATRRADGPAT